MVIRRLHKLPFSCRKWSDRDPVSDKRLLQDAVFSDWFLIWFWFYPWTNRRGQLVTANYFWSIYSSSSVLSILLPLIYDHPMKPINICLLPCVKMIFIIMSAILYFEENLDKPKIRRKSTIVIITPVLYNLIFFFQNTFWTPFIIDIFSFTFKSIAAVFHLWI